MKLFSVINSETSEASQVQGWYHSEFQNDLLNFTLEFTHLGAGEMCNYYWANYPQQNSIKLRSNKALYTNEDTVEPGELLNTYFIVHKYESDDLFIRFLISEKVNSGLIYTHDFYTFTAKIETDQNETFLDSCVVKKN